MRNTLPLLEKTTFPPIRRRRLETLQVNLGHLCNQRCLHCHVNAGPKRREIMAPEHIDLVLRFLEQAKIRNLDLTGGAPEMNPDFRRLVRGACELDVAVTDRCNLTILNEPGQEDTAEFLAANRVGIVASLPCYLESNVDAQRGSGVYQGSIAALKKLNALGYGEPGSGLQLDLVYNPQGASLPPPQAALQSDYQRELQERFGIRFSRLLTITNMPIKRFGSILASNGGFDDYIALLKSAHREENLESVMCRTLLSVDWQGYVYDCDFNQMLNLPAPFADGSRKHLSELDVQDLEGAPIAVMGHCYGCTAGQGSSCGGALE